MDPGTLDAHLPPAMAARAEAIGEKKAQMGLLPMFLLAMLAGAYIALGGLFTTIATTGGADLPYGVAKLLGGLAFSLGLILVVVGGAELFTGNTLLVMAWAGERISLGLLLRNWAVVYAGNLVGSLLTAALMFLTAEHTLDHGAVGLNALQIANAKCALTPTVALTRGIYCNMLVCLAVWLTYSCRSTGDRILAIVFPITAFVAAGFEHCVANMYLIPYAIAVRDYADVAYWLECGVDPAGYSALTWRGFLLGNLLPVTVGNVVGGALFVGAAYWLAYCRPARPGPEDRLPPRSG